MMKYYSWRQCNIAQKRRNKNEENIEKYFSKKQTNEFGEEIVHRLNLKKESPDSIEPVNETSLYRGTFRTNNIDLAFENASKNITVSVYKDSTQNFAVVTVYDAPEEEIKAFLSTVDKLPTITIDYVPDTYKGIFWKEMFIRYGLKKTEDAKESAGSISVTPTKWYIT